MKTRPHAEGRAPRAGAIVAGNRFLSLVLASILGMVAGATGAHARESQAAPLASSVAEQAMAAADDADWAGFKSRFVSRDGRVVDIDNGGVSHSEGQGYGMLLAVVHGDRATFDLLAKWSAYHLSRSNDRLSAWRYDPAEEPHVHDANNATDGDLYMAWAYARAATAWHEPGYAARAAAIAGAVLDECVIVYHGRTLLLPAAAGFVHANGVVLNLSYYAFAAFQALAAVAPDPRWSALRDDGLRLLRDARFGAWSLPPDWLLVQADGRLRPADGWPARFSYDAYRIPLNVAWAGLDEPALQTAVAMWQSFGSEERTPAWVDLGRLDRAAAPSGAGLRAIMEVGTARLEQRPARPLPPLARASGYYQSAMLLLAKVSDRESAPVPEASRERQQFAGLAGDGRSWSAAVLLARVGVRR